MTIILNKTTEIKEQLLVENKTYELTKTEDISMIGAVNQQMEIVRRDYQIKEKESQASAYNVILI